MNLIIFHSTSKKHFCKEISNTIEGDKVEIKHLKKYPKSFFCQLFKFGFQTVANREVKIESVDIDFSKYDDIYLVSPVWAGRVNAYMRQFLKNYQFKNKSIHIYYNSGGDSPKYLDSIKPFLDDSNKIVETKAYILGEYKQ